ncbi:unnamed protein product, partial [marine sediment metagenome]
KYDYLKFHRDGSDFQMFHNDKPIQTLRGGKNGLAKGWD